MSTSKKARASSPADEEKKELWDTYGRVRCDGLANSLKKDTNKTGYRHVCAMGEVSSNKHALRAKVWVTDLGREQVIGRFHTAYAAAVTAALSMEKGLQDKRDAKLLSGCLSTDQGRRRPPSVRV